MLMDLWSFWQMGWQISGVSQLVKGTSGILYSPLPLFTRQLEQIIRKYSADARRMSD